MIIEAMKRVALFVILISACCLTALAQSYSIDWYKISGGGGTSTSATYQVTGTIGQPDAGSAMSGGTYSLTGGFWSLISVIQTAGAPPLYISHSGNTVTIYWQQTTGWNLQQSSSLSSPTWAPSSAPALNNGTNSITITSPTGNLFFQLQQ